ncbi:MAG: transaldolase [Pseudomonadota bacterium]
MRTLEDLKIKIFADGADFNGIVEMSKNHMVKGFTTNPSLVAKAGEADYEDFARRVIAAAPDKPVSFEVFLDDFPGMIQQGRTIASWGPNVNAKVPVMNTRGEFAGEAIAALSAEGVVLNVTAIFTPAQVRMVAEALAPDVPAIVSVFAGRIADTGLDPLPLMQECLDILKMRPKAELLWASTREVLNIYQANDIGCHIITAPNDLIKKLSLAGKNLDAYSQETVLAFYQDATASGFNIAIK